LRHDFRRSAHRTESMLAPVGPPHSRALWNRQINYQELLPTLSQPCCQARLLNRSSEIPDQERAKPPRLGNTF
jgi:hypothetical protein